MQARVLLAAIALAACSKEETSRVAAYPYTVAAYVPASIRSETDVLRLFPSEGAARTIPLPFRLSSPMFAADGKSIYGTNASGKNGIYRNLPGLSRIEFNPTRITPVPGTAPFIIRSFDVSARQDKVVISGRRTDQDGIYCGVFEIRLPNGSVKQVLQSDCGYQSPWTNLSLSPDGERAVAAVGSNSNHDLHLELIDLIRGTTKSLGRGFWAGVWSPDGNWIAVAWNRKLFLLDAHDFTKRRDLGNTTVPAWSADSRHLLVLKYASFKCGFYIDVDPPATLEMLEISSGKRSTIRSSKCQLESGSAGWLSSEIMK